MNAATLIDGTRCPRRSPTSPIRKEATRSAGAQLAHAGAAEVPDFLTVSGRAKRLPMTAGSLLVIAGRHSLHRASPIHGSTPRLVALFGDDARPFLRSTPHLQRSRYGRIAQ